MIKQYDFDENTIESTAAIFMGFLFKYEGWSLADADDERVIATEVLRTGRLDDKAYDKIARTGSQKPLTRKDRRALMRTLQKAFNHATANPNR